MRPASIAGPALLGFPGNPMTRPSLKLVDWLCLAALVALAAAWASRPLSHDDLFGHLRTGEWMAAHRTVPKVDPFSFTRPGARWVTHEWGFSLLAWAVWLAAGYPGLIVARVALVLAIGAAVGWRMQTPRSIPWVTALLGLGLWALAAELILRAALVSELFLALTLVLLTRFRETGERRFLIAIAVLFFLWGNLHSGVIFGLFVLGLFALEGAFRERRPKPYLLTLGAAALASLINPNGIEVWLYPFKLSRILFASGIAWDLGHFAAADPRSNTALLILAVLLLAGLLPLEKVRELSIAEGVSILTFLALSFRSPRFLFHFAILALPVLYRLHVRRPLREWTPAMRRIAAAATVLVLALTAATAWLSHPRRLITPQLPEGAVRFRQANRIGGRLGHLFHHQNFGGFLLWRTHQPIFWDGRNDVFASLVQEVTTTPFPTIAEHYGIDELLITEHELPGIQPEIPDRWGLVYWDDDSALYLRRDGRFGPLLDRLELRLFPGFGGRPGLEVLARNPPLAAAARAELGRLLAVNPENQRALYFGGVISLYQGDLQRADGELRAALAVRPNEQVEKALAIVEGARSTAAPKNTSPPAPLPSPSHTPAGRGEKAG
jgi:hypothetical protein